MIKKSDFVNILDMLIGHEIKMRSPVFASFSNTVSMGLTY
jgi:hypothetical protein